MSNDMVSILEAATETGYNAVYLRRLAHSGEIKTRRIGRVWLVSVAELQERKRKGAIELRLQTTGKRKRAKAK